jgi:hypothetical protein
MFMILMRELGISSCKSGTRFRPSHNENGVEICGIIDAPYYVRSEGKLMDEIN